MKSDLLLISPTGVQYCHTLSNMSSSLMKCLLIFHLTADIKSTATHALQNSANTPQIKKCLFTRKSGEKSKATAAKRIAVDQDMVDWFEELFGKEPLPPPPVQLSPPGTLATLKPGLFLEGIEPRSYSLRDTDHKSLYLQDNNLMVAFLQGDDNSAEEEALSVLPNRSLDRKRFPLILGVKGGSQGISCGNEDEPRLQLEDTNLMHLFSNGEEAKRFTFFKSYNGRTHRFESVTHPGWYLSSSAETHKPLMLTRHLGGAAITDFHFNRK